MDKDGALVEPMNSRFTYQSDNVIIWHLFLHEASTFYSNPNDIFLISFTLYHFITWILLKPMELWIRLAD